MLLHLKSTLSASLFALSLYMCAPAYSNQKIASSAENFTVKIEGATQGSGVIIDKKSNTYTVLTAWHVIKDNKDGDELDVFTHDQKRHPAIIKSILKIPEVDMGLIKFKSTESYQEAELEDQAVTSAGIKSFVAGYPISSSAVPRRILRFTEGRIIAKTELVIPKGYQLLYSNQTYPGMSGGSVLNNSGKLIGIHGQGEIDIKLTKKEGIAVKTGTNQAVPISYYLEWNESNNYADRPDSGNDSLLELIAWSISDWYARSISYISRVIRSPGIIRREPLTYSDFIASSHSIADELKLDEDLHRKKHGNLFDFQHDPKKLEQLVSYSKKAVELNPNARSFNNLANAYTLQLDSFRLVRWLTPHEKKDIAKRKFQNNLIEGALSAALDLDENNISSLIAMGDLRETGSGQGLKYYSKALAIDSENTEVLKRRAWTYLRCVMRIGYWESCSSPKNEFSSRTPMKFYCGPPRLQRAPEVCDYVYDYLSMSLRDYSKLVKIASLNNGNNSPQTYEALLHRASAYEQMSISTLNGWKTTFDPENVISRRSHKRACSDYMKVPAEYRSRYAHSTLHHKRLINCTVPSG